MRFIQGRGAGAALFCALLLSGSERASAASATCEQEAVGHLHRYAMDSRGADTSGKARPGVDDVINRLEKSGFWKRCPEVRGGLVMDLNLVKTLPADNLKTFLEHIPTGGTLAAWQRALMAAHPVISNPEGANAEKCSAEAGLCKQDFETMFRNFNDIGGSEFFEATCVKVGQDGKNLGRACDFLKNMKKEGIDETTESNAFIEKHSTCRNLKGICSPLQFRRFKESMERVYRRWVVHMPQEFSYAVAIKFGGYKDCIGKMEKQRDVPGSTIPDWKADMTPEKYCREVADAAILAGETSCNASSEHYDVETKKCYLFCPSGQKYVADNHKCEAESGGNTGGNTGGNSLGDEEGGGTSGANKCTWGVADPATGECAQESGGGGG